MTDVKKWVAHNYQKTAVSFLLDNPMSALFLDPGLGKTSTILATMKILLGIKEVKGILLIAPLRVVYGVWPEEIRKWINFNNLTYTIIHKDTKNTLWDMDKDIYLINPEGLEWLHSELLHGLNKGKKCPFNALVVDESTKFQSHDCNRFQYLINMLPLFSRRHILTGTPAPKSLLGLWSQIYLLDEGASLGTSYNAFRNKYFETNGYNTRKWFVKDFSKKQIYGKIAPLVLEMSAKDYLDMPELVINDIYVELNKKAMKTYKSMEKNFFAEVDEQLGELFAGASAQARMICHQIANGRAYESIPEDLDEDEIKEFKKTRKTLKIHTSKIDALDNLIDELHGKPLLVAYHYKHDLAALRDLLGKDVPHIGSGVTGKKLEKIIKDWNAGKIPVLLGHPTSMAHGLNLQSSGDDLCFFSLIDSTENYIQFIARIWRQGNFRQHTRLHRIIAKGTIDEAIIKTNVQSIEDQIDLRDALRDHRASI